MGRPATLKRELSDSDIASIRDYAEREGKVDYIDVFTPMLDASGRPRPELFRADSLHLNANGYALWKRVIAPHVH